MINSTISGNKVSSLSQEAFSLYEKSSLGEKINKKIEYAQVEALYLVFEEKMDIFSNNKKIQFEELVKIFKKTDKKIESKFIVFKDLRKKGYVVKTALKFGADFRVYDKGIKPGEDHAKWIVFVTNENENLKWHDFAAKNRIAHSTKKNLIIGIIDEESDASYYEISWIKP